MGGVTSIPFEIEEVIIVSDSSNDATSLYREPNRDEWTMSDDEANYAAIGEDSNPPECSDDQESGWHDKPQITGLRGGIWSPGTGESRRLVNSGDRHQTHRRHAMSKTTPRMPVRMKEINDEHYPGESGNGGYDYCEGYRPSQPWY